MKATCRGKNLIETGFRRLLSYSHVSFRYLRTRIRLFLYIFIYIVLFFVGLFLSDLGGISLASVGIRYSPSENSKEFWENKGRSCIDKSTKGIKRESLRFMAFWSAGVKTYPQIDSAGERLNWVAFEAPLFAKKMAGTAELWLACALSDRGEGRVFYMDPINFKQRGRDHEVSVYNSDWMAVGLSHISVGQFVSQMRKFESQFPGAKLHFNPASKVLRFSSPDLGVQARLYERIRSSRLYEVIELEKNQHLRMSSSAVL